MSDSQGNMQKINFKTVFANQSRGSPNSRMASRMSIFFKTVAWQYMELVAN